MAQAEIYKNGESLNDAPIEAKIVVSEPVFNNHVRRFVSLLMSDADMTQESGFDAAANAITEVFGFEYAETVVNAAINNWLGQEEEYETL